APRQAPLWGFGRTVALEHSELACMLIDLSSSAAEEELDSLCGEICSDGPENQIALRGTERHVARLVRYAPDQQSTFAPADGQDFRLEIDSPGILDRLILRAAQRRAPGPGEVEIRVHAAGLNFLDVLAAMGVRPDLPDGPVQLGGECSGIIAAVGDGVEAFQ